ncbi:MAG: DUF998 domain-containing protein [Candidatus Freyarchaeum deiterrae]
MARTKSTSSSGVSSTLIGGIIAVGLISFAVACILGSVLLYTSSPLRLYSLDLFGGTIWYPWFNFGYNWTTQWISDLGVGPSAFIFNVGLMIAGVVCLPFFPTLLKPLGYTRSAKIGVVIGIVAGAALIGIGAFPETTGFYHPLFSVLFWSLFAVSAGVLSFAMRSTSLFPRATQYIGYFELVGGLTTLVLSGIYGAVPEWIMLLILVIWVYAAGITMLIKGRTS